jgi:hypothetical protein
MTNNEIIKELLVYDGYTFHDTADGVGFFTNGQDNEGFEYWYKHSERQDYLDDMNILHRLSLGIVGQLKEMYSEEDSAFDFEHDMKVTDVKGSIVAAMFKDKNQDGEYIELATSLVEAIQFINQHKPSDKK